MARHRIQHPHGVTSGPMMFADAGNPAKLFATARNEKIDLQFNDKLNFGCSSRWPVTVIVHANALAQFRWKWTANSNCDVWWNGSRARRGWPNWSQLVIASPTVIALAPKLDAAMPNLTRIFASSASSAVFPHDVGQSLWPPGNGLVQSLDECLKI